MTLAGIFDPADYPLTDDDFYDGFHAKASAVAWLAPSSAWVRPAEGHGP